MMASHEKTHTNNGEQQQPVNPNYNVDRNIVDLILGSDLIYSHDVVEKLFQTVSVFMTPGGTFLLSQSFAFDSETEQAIHNVCHKLLLQRSILSDTLADGNEGCRIQQFTWKVPSKESDGSDEQEEEQAPKNLEPATAKED